MDRVIAYVDGFNLYFGLRSKGWKRYYWLDLHQMSQRLLKSGQQLQAVKYFTARIAANTNNPDKQRRQSTFLEAVESLPLTRVFYGHYLPKRRECFNCGATWTTHEEKMTDVNISVELMKDAFDDAFDTALLFSGDSDLAAPVEMVLTRYPSKRIVMVWPPGRHSHKLESLASDDLWLGRGVLQNCQLPDPYTKPDGFLLRRPAQWV